MGVQRRLVELVGLKPQSRPRRRARRLARCWCGRNAGSSISPPARPMPGGRRPTSSPVRSTIRLGGDALVRPAGRYRSREQKWFHARLRRIRRTEVQRLLVDVRDAMLAVGRWECQHRDVAIELLPRLGQFRRQRALAEERWRGCGRGSAASNRAGPRDVGFAGDEVLHGLLGLDPRPAGAAPARSGPQGDLMSSRSASEMACLKSSCHGGLMKCTGPRGMPTSTSRKIAPPMPARCIASRSAVIPSRLRLPSMNIPIDPGPGRVGRRRGRPRPAHPLRAGEGPPTAHPRRPADRLV